MATTQITRLFDQASDDPTAGGIVSSPDLDRYRSYVAHLDMPEARKTDMLLAVRRVMQNFVDRAFGDDPVQRSGALEDKMRGTEEPAALPVVELPNDQSADDSNMLNDEFHRHAVGDTDKQEKR